LEWLLQAKLLQDHGWRCTAQVTWSVLLRAAARMVSICAACRDLAGAPSDQAVFDALHDGLPKTLDVLEHRVNQGLTDYLPRRLRRRAWRLRSRSMRSTIWAASEWRAAGISTWWRR